MGKSHNHGTTSSTDEVFRTFIGCKVKGLLHFYNGWSHRVLVFECGWGLVFCSTGAYWAINPDDVQAHLRRSRQDLTNTQKELEGILALAGE